MGETILIAKKLSCNQYTRTYLMIAVYMLFDTRLVFFIWEDNSVYTNGNLLSIQTAKMKFTKANFVFFLFLIQFQLKQIIAKYDSNLVNVFNFFLI